MGGGAAGGRTPQTVPQAGCPRSQSSAASDGPASYASASRRKIAEMPVASEAQWLWGEMRMSIGSFASPGCEDNNDYTPTFTMEMRQVPQ